MADTFASYAKRLQRFEREMSDEGMSHAVGRMAKDEAAKAARADLGGDEMFSGWPQAELVTRYDVLDEGSALLKPTRRSAGGWTVAEFGRNTGRSANSPILGPGVNRRTGLTSRTKTGRIRKVRAYGAARRWNGVTRGKNTASDAHDAIERKLPRVVDQRLARTIRSVF